MADFDPEKFISEPCEDTFYDLKKDELISLAKHLKLEVKKTMRKHQIQDNIVKHLVSVQVLASLSYTGLRNSEQRLQRVQRNRGCRGYAFQTNLWHYILEKFGAEQP